ncbi:hypothetical protein H6F43_09590 [Leptolyngbya sp. FACHB-36]|uniref:hypothetical protein n=1 Tax=Leptolyngbya sp. FACHB-36 TaxID=2692808 RepID=UPI0016819F5B|nr:hypothetical protein [Leptolyngbya sp. FACHB-36]MBD2020439.1 hypothetical protein [Leptolyngbya sp. FACHB-36]
MNSDIVVDMLQKGFRVTLGATTSLIEVLQDPEKRQENLAKLSQEWSQLSEDWAAKGFQTEQEARSFVDSLVSQQPSSTTAASPPSGTTAPTAPPDVQLELQELTAQIAAIRAELERLRNQDSSSQ